MTRLDALRELLSKPREKDMERIGHRVIAATPIDEQVRIPRFTKWQAQADRILRRLA